MRYFLIISMMSLCVAMPVCDKVNSSLNRGLEEEKSYSRHAMEYHREHPEKRPGDRVLETWSTADYVAQAVATAKIPGNWARFSNQLEFLKPAIQKNATGLPFCVIQHDGTIIVLSYLTEPPDCTLQSADGVKLAGIQSGDMEFSGRSDFWVYLLRP